MGRTARRRRRGRRVARALLVELGASNLEIASGSLESAFIAITAAPDRDACTEQEIAR